MIQVSEIVYPASVEHTKENSRNLAGGAMLILLYGIINMDMFAIVPYVNIVRPFLLFVAVLLQLGTAASMRFELWVKQSDRCVYRTGGSE